MRLPPDKLSGLYLLMERVLNKRYRLKKTDYPKCLRGYPELKGIYVNGCIEDGSPWNENSYAHTHRKTSKHPGIICVENESSLFNEMSMLHELAHLLTSGYGHRDPWRKKFIELGGKAAAKRIAEFYPKRTRR